MRAWLQSGARGGPLGSGERAGSSGTTRISEEEAVVPIDPRSRSFHNAGNGIPAPGRGERERGGLLTRHVRPARRCGARAPGARARRRPSCCGLPRVCGASWSSSWRAAADLYELRRRANAVFPQPASVSLHARVSSKPLASRSLARARAHSRRGSERVGTRFHLRSRRGLGSARVEDAHRAIDRDLPDGTVREAEPRRGRCARLVPCS